MPDIYCQAIADQYLMHSQKVVIPAKAGIQGFCNDLKFLDFRLRGNDGNEELSTFSEFIIIRSLLFHEMMVIICREATFAARIGNGIQFSEAGVYPRT